MCKSVKEEKKESLFPCESCKHSEKMHDEEPCMQCLTEVKRDNGWMKYIPLGVETPIAVTQRWTLGGH